MLKMAAALHENRLVYFEEFDSVNEAIVRESEIKQTARRTKVALIESTNPEGETCLQNEQWNP
jgi:predicted GIY-YIG superfamily endonuclease